MYIIYKNNYVKVNVRGQTNSSIIVKSHNNEYIYLKVLDMH